MMKFWRSAILSASVVLCMPAYAQETFTIGAPASLSGKYADYGNQAKNGVETAIEVWKQVHGDKVAGRPINVLVRDTQSNNATTVSLINMLIETDKVDVIVGPDGSNVAAAAVPPWKKQEDRPIWFAPGGSSSVLEEEVGVDPYFFHTYAWTYYYHQNTSQAFKEIMGADKKVAFIYSDGAYGRAHIDDAKKYFEEAGFEIVASELVREGATDFNPTLMRIRARHPDILYLLVQTNDAVQLTKQIAAARLDVSLLVGTAQVQLSSWQEAVGVQQECWTGVTTWVSGLKYPADEREPKIFPSAADFEKMWMEKYKRTPDFLEVSYYISTMLAMLAADETGSVDREVMKDWLEKQNYNTPLGVSKFEKSRVALHQAFGTMVVFQRQKQDDGSFKSVIVYPKEAATGDLNLCK
ncbi:ABC transporter substrate-binding protein [Pseudorhizobium flavum]|uniref:Branched-chain amino acid transport system substrate-binding protein n=1 Tax=Pseudorhizobium flavum TaxID=1335061 RepID=A0A7X0DFA2_9HYPH|nr:ABC transporter substrate-binding protein [Pseudorhizobium flavum]MBB6181926.1 branched-chain amino acid transport system substrate-binding protein [Pseudorhizobium flavum]CAD6628784.1 ABC transporter substrate-binding protein [Pseudorhizobium flavum]